MALIIIRESETTLFRAMNKPDLCCCFCWCVLASCCVFGKMTQIPLKTHSPTDETYASRTLDTISGVSPFWVYIISHLTYHHRSSRSTSSTVLLAICLRIASHNSNNLWWWASLTRNVRQVVIVAEHQKGKRRRINIMYWICSCRAKSVWMFELCVMVKVFTPLRMRSSYRCIKTNGSWVENQVILIKWWILECLLILYSENLPFK